LERIEEIGKPFLYQTQYHTVAESLVYIYLLK